MDLGHSHTGYGHPKGWLELHHFPATLQIKHLNVSQIPIPSPRWQPPLILLGAPTRGWPFGGALKGSSISLWEQPSPGEDCL